MDSPIAIHSFHNHSHPTLSPCGSVRRLSIGSEANSPEFEFWRVRNSSCFPPTAVLTADELFSDGFLLPLHLVPTQTDAEHESQDNHTPQLDVESGLGPEIASGSKSIAELTSETSTPSSSKRWTDIFRKSEKKNEGEKPKEEKEKKNKKKKKNKQQSREKGQSGSGTAELNINIWPFSRSRSAGNSVSRPRMSFGVSGSRKSSSAPCSRSNSAGESKSRKWPNSPGRSGVHVGRSSPVWQVRRGNSGGKGPWDAATKTEERAKAGLNLNVPMCIGYRTRLSCRSDEKSVVRKGDSNSGCGSSNFGNGGHNLFGLRSLFATKKAI